MRHGTHRHERCCLRCHAITMRYDVRVARSARRRTSTRTTPKRLAISDDSC